MYIDTISPLDRYTLGFDNTFDLSLFDHVQLVNGPEPPRPAIPSNNNDSSASRLPSFWTPDDVGTTEICIRKLSDLSVRFYPVYRTSCKIAVVQKEHPALSSRR